MKKFKYWWLITFACLMTITFGACSLFHSHAVTKEDWAEAIGYKQSYSYVLTSGQQSQNVFVDANVIKINQGNTDVYYQKDDNVYYEYKNQNGWVKSECSESQFNVYNIFFTISTFNFEDFTYNASTESYVCINNETYDEISLHFFNNKLKHCSLKLNDVSFEYKFSYREFVINLPTQEDTSVITTGELSFHFLELGNKYTGDCTYIKAGDIDILIDAGSKVSSIPTITSYINKYVTDNTLEYVIVTHAHQDHYAGFAGNSSSDSLFDIYEVEVIIDFAQTNQTTGVMYNNYLAERDAEVANGAKHYTALDCINQTNGAQNVFNITDDVSMKILNQKFYTQKASSENDYSVCTLFTHGTRNFLFTGDLEEEGEESLAELNDLPHCELYKAGHHGSKTSSHNVLLNEITPQIVCVCCCAGNYEYTDANENNFPTQDFVDRIAPHTDCVYVTTLGIPTYNEETQKYKNDSYTSMNGNIVVTSNGDGVVVNCSNNNTKLKDTEWFKQNRTMPQEWEQAG